MSTLPVQTKEQTAPAVEACWNDIGVHGNRSCERLETVVHCRNCPVYSRAGLQLLERPLLAEYRRAWTAHFAQEKAAAAQARASAVLFRVGGEWFALPTPALQEVAERRMVHSLPHRGQGVLLGLVNIRGELLICISLGHFLGLDQRPLHATRRSSGERLLVTQWEGHHFVFPAEEVRSVHRFQPAELTEPPATLTKSMASFTKGILIWQGRSVGLLDTELLFSALNRSLM